MAIETPCIRICTLDPQTGWCLGCGRSGAEIGRWLGYSEAERRQVMAALPARMARLAAPAPVARLGAATASKPVES